LAHRQDLPGNGDSATEAPAERCEPLRIGVNTGEVVVGCAREGSSFVTGDAVNVGARLERAAAPGEELRDITTLEVDERRIERTTDVQRRPLARFASSRR
jgi:class 3 adenylate cyclase